jgi:hypothetical protein
MGFRLPIYPYLVAQRKGLPRMDLQKGLNARNLRLVDELRNYLANEKVKNKASNLIPNDVDLFEIDDGGRPERKRLLDEVGDRGTILAPNMRHIMGSRDDGSQSKATLTLMSKIVKESIEVVSIKHPKHDLSEVINGGKPCDQLFKRVPGNGIDNMILIQRSINGGKAFHA